MHFGVGRRAVPNGMYSVTSEQCRVSRPQFPRSMHGKPGTMTPLLATKTVAFSVSCFPTEALVKRPFRVTCEVISEKGEIQMKNTLHVCFQSTVLEK